MISLNLTVSPADPKLFLVEVTGPLTSLRGLNAVLAQRLADELVEHFRGKDDQPNKRGWKKSHFWNQVGRSTQVGEVTETGATVVVADTRYRIQLFGGVVKPTGGRKWLTIPLVEDARGLNVASYEKKTGRELFRIGHARVLFEKRQRGGSSSLLGAGTGQRWHKGASSDVALNARQQLRAVYALSKSVKIPADPTALPTAENLRAALTEEAGDYLDTILKGGGA